MNPLRHESEGIEELPILLKLSRGREIMLQLRGVTVKPGVAYPQIAHKSHTLQPVIIGSDCPPIQVEFNCDQYFTFEFKFEERVNGETAKIITNWPLRRQDGRYSTDGP